MSWRNEVGHQVILTIILYGVDFAREHILDVLLVAILPTAEHNFVSCFDQTAHGLDGFRYVRNFRLEAFPSTFPRHYGHKCFSQIRYLVTVSDLISHSSPCGFALDDLVVSAEVWRDHRYTGTTVEDGLKLLPSTGQRSQGLCSLLDERLGTRLGLLLYSVIAQLIGLMQLPLQL